MLVLKISYNGEIHRIQFDHSPDHACIQQAVQDLWPSSTIHWIKYFDEEGDLCTLVEATFTDFRQTAQEISGGRQLLRVEIDCSPPVQDSDYVEAMPAAEDLNSLDERRKMAAEYAEYVKKDRLVGEILAFCDGEDEDDISHDERMKMIAEYTKKIATFLGASSSWSRRQIAGCDAAAETDIQVSGLSEVSAVNDDAFGALTARLDEAVVKVAEHERCTRVLLCDVVPRVGELSDTRDEVKEYAAQEEVKLLMAEHVAMQQKVQDQVRLLKEKNESLEQQLLESASNRCEVRSNSCSSNSCSRSEVSALELSPASP